MKFGKNNAVARHVIQTTVATMRPQDAYRQSGSGEVFASGSIMTPGKWDRVLWIIFGVIVVATFTMKLWLPLFGIVTG